MGMLRSIRKQTGESMLYSSALLSSCLLCTALLLRVSQYKKGKTSLDLNEARDDGNLGMQWLVVLEEIVKRV